jgi:hypothetical protein
MTRKIFHLIARLALGLLLTLTACAPRPAPRLRSYPQPQAKIKLPSTPGPSLTSTAVPAAPAPMTIFANQNWQDTHLFVHPGDTLEITATGAWSHDPADPQYSNLYGPGGMDVFDARAILASAPVGSLLGRIGDNPPFVVGEHLVLTSESRGDLWLVMNDDPDKVSDNTGFVGAAILSAPRPPVRGLVLKSTRDGYSLVYPSGYYVVITENGICITQGSSQFPGCGPATLEVRDAEGKTAHQVADSIVPKNDLNFQVGTIDDLMIDGEPAARVDLETPDGHLTLVTIVHPGRAYIWRFGPVQMNVSDPGDGVYSSEATPAEQVDRLYDTVINSFEFLP